MHNAMITGWGKCLPPAVLSNADLATFLPTDDEWIKSRTGISERRVSHVNLGELTYVASMRALAAAGLKGSDIDMIVFGSCSYDDQVPNMASGLQRRIGAEGCGAMDINTACTSFLYGLSAANALIRTGVIRNALLVGAELISPFMDWHDRNVAVLFGDGAAAVVLERTDEDAGLLAEKLGCYGNSREILRIHGMGGNYANKGWLLGRTAWQFEGQEIFKKAVGGMSSACKHVLKATGITAEQVDIVIPHQANLRIIDSVGKHAGVAPEKMFINVQRYGNMSAATVPVALCEALEQGRIKPGSLLLMPAFGGGLTFCAHLMRWGSRIQPLGESAVELPPATESALTIVNRYRALKPPLQPVTAA